MYRLRMERSLCIACGNCVDICPEFWEMADDGFSHLKESKKVEEMEERENEDDECILDAAENCPVSCIHVYEDEEEII